MAHFAELTSSNHVLRVIRVSDNELLDENGNEVEELGIAFCQSLFGADTRWKQTSYNGSFRRNYAGIGFTYDEPRDAFIPQQPFLSWRLDEETCQWVPPVARPDDENPYQWDELNREWVAV
jgi:hypothetical protein